MLAAVAASTQPPAELDSPQDERQARLPSRDGFKDMRAADDGATGAIFLAGQRLDCSMDYKWGLAFHRAISMMAMQS